MVQTICILGCSNIETLIVVFNSIVQVIVWFDINMLEASTNQSALETNKNSRLYFALLPPLTG